MFASNKIIEKSISHNLWPLNIKRNAFKKEETMLQLINCNVIINLSVCSCFDLFP